jgi:hypothetical protein
MESERNRFGLEPAVFTGLQPHSLSDSQKAVLPEAQTSKTSGNYLVGHFEHFNFLHVEYPRSREKRPPSSPVSLV